MKPLPLTAGRPAAARPLRIDAGARGGKVAHILRGRQKRSDIAIEKRPAKRGKPNAEALHHGVSGAGSPLRVLAPRQQVLRIGRGTIGHLKSGVNLVRGKIELDARQSVEGHGREAVPSGA